MVWARARQAVPALARTDRPRRSGRRRARAGNARRKLCAAPDPACRPRTDPEGGWATADCAHSCGWSRYVDAVVIVAKLRRRLSCANMPPRRFTTAVSAFAVRRP